MTAFVDSHVHLADPAFDADAEAVIVRARNAGAVGLIAIGESPSAAARARQIARQHPEFVAWTAGVHPHDAASFEDQRDVDAIREHVQAGAVAIGECGLDYHYDNSPRQQQRMVFARQLALAAELGRPVVVHTRDAADDTADMLREAAAAGVRGVLHCFSGPARLASTALEAGWYLSFSGIVTFRKWADDALLRMVPDDRLLVETDAPYLAPVPYRGKRNEPSWIPHTLARLATARSQPPDLVGALTVANARRLFDLALRTAVP
jgi:TatD DNase family protein